VTAVLASGAAAAAAVAKAHARAATAWVLHHSLRCQCGLPAGKQQLCWAYPGRVRVGKG
jgi:hypothetical protein